MKYSASSKFCSLPSGFTLHRLSATAMLLVAALTLAACSGGGGGAPAPINRAPIISSIGDQSVAEDSSAVFSISATDPDGDALTITTAQLPPFINVTDLGSNDWNLTIEPGFDDAGDYPISIRIADDKLAADTEIFMLTVVDVNRAPNIAALGNISISEGQTQTVDLTAADPDGDALTFSGNTLPAFIALSDNTDNTAELILTPGYFANGAYPISVQVTDSGSLTDEINAVITVENVNRAPLLTPINAVSVAESELLPVPLSALDPDGDALSLSVVGLPAFASAIDNGNGTGTLNVAPGFFDSGSYPVIVRATDSESLTDEMSFNIVVSNVNQDPVLNSINDIALNEGDTLFVALNGSDPDGGDIVFSGIGLPAFASITDNGDGTANLDLQPDFSHSGIYPVTLQITDSSAGIDAESFFITVGDVNQAPVLSTIADPIVGAENVFIVPLAANDPDADNLIFQTSNLPPFITLTDNGDGSGSLQITAQIPDIGSYSFIVRTIDSGFPSLSDEQTVQLSVTDAGANQVAIENALAGTPDWHLDNPALLREIEGYASATSVNRGAAISLFVNTNAPMFSLEIFRTGWYGGVGARRVLGPIAVSGTSQITPAPDPTSGLVEANWLNPIDIQTSNAINGDPWATGVYLARLTESVSGTQSYIIFVVREDGQHHDVLFQLPVTTYQAYNAWGGKSIYDFSSGITEPWGSTSGPRANHVSFDRPYARNTTDSAGYGMGAGEYLTNVQPIGRIAGAGWDYNMVRWLEYEQYDVGYITNLDTHRSPSALLNTELFLSQGHDEYWSWEMRDNVEAARDSGVDLAFFSSNTAFAQIRFEPSPTTTIADRVMVAYRIASLDPYFTDPNPLNDYLTTVPFRTLPVPRPEEEMIGVQYVLDPYDGDIIVTNPTHWVYDKTGLIVGSRLVGLLGYEPDGMFGSGPANLEVLAETPIVSSVDPLNTGISHMTIYSAASGASVFATGSLQWSWGLDDFNVPQMRTSRLSAAAQQITGNVLESFGATPHMGDSVTAACVRVRSLSDAANDMTFAAAEFELLDASGIAIAKTSWSIAFVDSEETVGADLRAIYSIDSDPATYWQTQWVGLDHPHEIHINLGDLVEISALRYLPRQDGSLNGTIDSYEIYTSPDCASWTPVASGFWELNSGRKIARFGEL